MVVFLSSLALVLLTFLGPTFELFWRQATKTLPVDETEPKKLGKASKIALVLLTLTLVSGLINEFGKRAENLEAIEHSRVLREKIDKLTFDLAQSTASQQAFTIENERLSKQIALLKSQNSKLDSNLVKLADENRKSNTPTEYSTTILAGTYKFHKPASWYEVTLRSNGTWDGKETNGLGFSTKLKGEWQVDYDRIKITSLGKSIYGTTIQSNIVDDRIVYWLPEKTFETKDGTEFSCVQ